MIISQLGKTYISSGAGNGKIAAILKNIAENPHLILEDELKNSHGVKNYN